MFTLALGTPTTGFEGEFRFLADLQGLGTSVGRHPSADMLPIFNDTFASLREQVTQWGYTQYLTRGTTTTFAASGATSPFETGETYAVLNLGTIGVPGTPPTAEQVKAIDVFRTTGSVDRLEEIPFSQLRDRYRQPNYRGQPMNWCLLDMGKTTGANFTGTGKIAIVPIPIGGSYAIWTLDRFTPLSSASDVFAYHNSDWKQWHMFTAMSRLCGVRDKDTAQKLTIIMNELDPERPGSLAMRVKDQAPTASGPKTWTRSQNYRGGAWNS